MASRSLSLCSGLEMPISRWISVSDSADMMAPLLTLARQAATYHAGMPTHSWGRQSGCVRYFKHTHSWCVRYFQTYTELVCQVFSNIYTAGVSQGFKHTQSWCVRGFQTHTELVRQGASNTHSWCVRGFQTHGVGVSKGFKHTELVRQGFLNT